MQGVLKKIIASEDVAKDLTEEEKSDVEDDKEKDKKVVEKIVLQNKKLTLLMTQGVAQILYEK